MLTRAKDIWVTQAKNAKMLQQAFETCRHVILVFSVNKSMAFQGYVSVARSEMSCGAVRDDRP